jgi:hypothetical protein
MSLLIKQLKLREDQYVAKHDVRTVASAFSILLTPVSFKAQKFEKSAFCGVEGNLAVLRNHKVPKRHSVDNTDVNF